jgi:hypothetical protein
VTAPYPQLPPETVLAVDTVLRSLCGNNASGHVTMCDHNHQGDAEGLIRLLSATLGPALVRFAAEDLRFSNPAKRNLLTLADEMEAASRPQPMS